MTPLSDNHEVDQYFYQIIVFTGHRKDAATESKVRLIICWFFISHVFSNRSILLLEATTTRQVFALLLILIERFYNVVELMHLS